LPGLRSRGFAFTDEQRGKFGWVGRRAGDEISFCVLGDADGGHAGAGASGSAGFQGVGVGGGSAVGVDGTAPNAGVAGAALGAASRRRRDGAGLAPAAAGGRTRTAACVDVASAEHCRQQRAYCGMHTHAKLLKQCPLSCGMCAPAASDAQPPPADAPAPAVRAAARGRSRGGGGAAALVGLWVGYLESYEHMGRVTLTCTGGCACAPSEIDAHDPPAPRKPRVSITAVRRVALRLPAPPVGVARPLPATDGAAWAPAVAPAAASSSAASAAAAAAAANASSGAAACCRITLRIDEQSSSGEHKFKLNALLLAEAAEGDHWQPPGVKGASASALDMMHRVKDVDEAANAKGRGKRGGGPKRGAVARGKATGGRGGRGRRQLMKI
jgi:hypothetical protein